MVSLIRPLFHDAYLLIHGAANDLTEVPQPATNDRENLEAFELRHGQPLLIAGQVVVPAPSGGQPPFEDCDCARRIGASPEAASAAGWSCVAVAAVDCLSALLDSRVSDVGKRSRSLSFR